MKTITTHTMRRYAGSLLLLLTLSSCAHLSLGYPSISKSFPTIPEVNDSAKKTLPSQQILAITSSTQTSPPIQFPSQSKSTPVGVPLQTFPPLSSSNKYKFLYVKKMKNFLDNRETTTIQTTEKVQLSPTNVTRQIGNSSGNLISLDLHQKVTEGEELNLTPKVGVGARVTDVNTKFGFQAGLSSSSLELPLAKPSIPSFVHLTENEGPKAHVNSDHDDIQTQTDANSDTNTLQPVKENGNGNSFTDNKRKKVGESFVIKKVLGVSLHLPSNKNSLPDTQFLTKDNNTDTGEDGTNRWRSHVFLDSPPTTKGPEKNSNSNLGVPLVSKTRQPNDNVDTSIQFDTSEHYQNLEKSRISQDKNGPLKKVEDDSTPDFGGDLYFTKDLKEQGPSCYHPVLVNQETFLENGDSDRTGAVPKDMDKWEKNLVKMSQCVATCLEGSLRKDYDMSREKGINELGGTSSDISGKPTFPVGIPTLALNLGGGNYNGAINPYYSRDKMLSTCQKDCNFLPEKSPISIDKTPQSLLEDSPSSRDNGSNRNHNEMPGEDVKAEKTDKNSSVGETDAKNKTSLKINTTQNTNTTQFHLHWPKVISSAGSRSKTPSVIIYNVMILSPNPHRDKDQDKESYPYLLPPTWKLIDQTVSQQTQISLRTPSCGEKPTSQSEEMLITQSLHDKSHSDPIPQSVYDPIPLKVMAIGSHGVEKVFSGLLILMSSSTDKSNSTQESACCQSSGESGAISRQHSATFNTKISNPLRDLDHHSEPLRELRKENTNSTNVPNPRKSNFVILRRNKNSNIASNEINFKRSRNSVEVETLATRGKIDTDNTNEVKGNENEKDVNRDEAGYELESSKLKDRRTTSSDWDLRTLAMVYQNFLVVTEIGWKVPDALSSRLNQVEKGAGRAFSPDKNINGDDIDTGRRSISGNLVSLPDPLKGKKIQFLLTWEIYGGGLKGNLVTDTTSGSISLWPDTAYYIQVGVIDTDSSQPSEGTLTSSQEQENHQNYMSNLLGLESIIFPLATQPRVTLSSPRLLLNTSSVSRKLSPKKSPSLRSKQNSVALITPRQNDRTRPKSNNPLLSPNYLHSMLRAKNKVKLDKEEAQTGNVRPIPIPGGTVSRNGNEGGNGHLPFHSKSGSWTRNGHLLPSQSVGGTSSPSSYEAGGDHSSQTSDNHLALDTSFDKHNKKYYEKNYKREDDHKSSPYSHDKNDGPFKKLSKSSLLLQQENDLAVSDDKLHGTLYHHHSHSRHYLDTSSSRSNGLLPNITTNSTTHSDRTPNINDNKSGNNQKMGKISAKKPGSDHHKEIAPGSGSASAYRPEGYQGLFALNLGLGGYNYQYDHDEVEMNSGKFGNNATTGINVGDTGASVVYSIFVLIVVGCVIFLFLVAFIGFFVVTSSISSTAQFFIPKRLRVWVVGGDSEGELLAGNEEDEICYGYEDQGGGRGFGEDGRFMGDDLDDDLAAGEWGDDVGEEERGQEYSLSEASSRRRGQTEVDVDMTHCDIGRT